MDVSCTFGSTAFDLEGDFIQSLDRDYDDVVTRFWDTVKEKYGINRLMDWAEGTQPLPGPIENTAF